MTLHKAADGSTFTDEDIERWVQEHERGYEGAHLTPPRIGRPISVGQNVRPFTIRLDEARRERLRSAAAERNLTPSELMRELIDTL